MDEDDNNNGKILQQFSFWFNGLKIERCGITQCALVSVQHTTVRLLPWTGHSKSLSGSLVIVISHASPVSQSSISQFPTHLRNWAMA